MSLLTDTPAGRAALYDKPDKLPIAQAFATDVVTAALAC